MNRIKRLSTLALLLLAVPAFANAGNAALKQQAEQWERSFNAGDAAAVAALYAEDAHVLPPGSDIVKGRAAIEEFWGAVIDEVPGKNTLETLELSEMGDFAVEIGTYSEEGGDHGKYLVVWKKHGDKWLMHRDIWNSSAESGSSD